MTVEYLPTGVKCNLKCTYCYQEPMREAGNFSVPANFVRAKAAIEKAKDGFALFGGEPLLTPIEQLAEIFEYGDSIKNNNGLQTNGLLITDAHIALFKKHNVHVGISIDGPPLCNIARSSEQETEHIIGNIRKCLAAELRLSLIITIHALSATYLDQLLLFIDDMYTSGIGWFNFHNLEVDNEDTRQQLKLSDTNNFITFARLYKHCKGFRTPPAPFGDIRNLLSHDKAYASCIWTACDPITTQAVHGINAEGSLTNCGRTNKAGVDWLKGSGPRSLERYIALSNTSQEHGGCKGCEYFFACKGNCPGTAIDGDWRNRTADCVFWYSLIDYIRQDMIADGVPVLDVDEANRKFIEQISRPISLTLSKAHEDIPHGDHHEDHTDHARIST